MRLKVNVVRAPNKRLSEYKPRIGIDELKRYGFDKVTLNINSFILAFSLV